MLQISDFSLQKGIKVLFDQANATIFPGHKVALIGANGCGKTSLLSCIVDLITDPASHPEISFPKDWRIATVKQETPDSDRSAIDYVIDGHKKLRAIEAQLEIANHNNDGHRIAALHHQLDEINAYQITARASELLSGLGFSEAEQHRAVKQFSGGWRMRLNLAQALLIDSDCLLLDEPTNHLDLDAVIWLEKFLIKYPGTLVLISHDRDFIDNICQTIFHIEQQKINSYTGNYSDFERQRSEKLAQQQANYQRQQAEIKHIQSFVDRFKAKASKAKQAQSRVKMLERMETIAPAHVDSPFHFEFEPSPQLPNPIMVMDKVSAGYQANAPILSNIHLNLVPGSRIGLLGRNGAGKSTLIKTLACSIAPLGGELQHSKHLKIGYFAQHQLDLLHKGSSPVNHLIKLKPELTEQQARNYLGGFGFSGDQAVEVIDYFSGGEKARLVLALLVSQKPNLLLLDEPTNHLDIEMRQALTFALQSFDGAMLLISHDRHLLKSCCDDLYLVAEGAVGVFNGDLDDYHKWLLTSDDNKEKQSKSSEPTAGVSRKDQKRIDAELRQQLAPLKKQSQHIEKQQSALQALLADIEQQMTDPELYEPNNKAKLSQLIQKQTAAKTELSELEDSWFELEEQMDLIREQANQ